MDYQEYRENVCAHCPDQCDMSEDDIDNCQDAFSPFEDIKDWGGDARTPQH